jgi:Domain of unknown function (DUF4234)
MAEVIDIRGSSHPGKIRHPLGVIGLSFITLGIYFWVWYYMTNKELAEIGRAHNTEELGDSPGTSLLAMTLGAFIIVPPFVSLWNYSKRVDAAVRLTGQRQRLEQPIMFVLWVFLGVVSMYLTQESLNDVLRAQSGGSEALGSPQQAAAAQQPAAQPAQPPQAG